MLVSEFRRRHAVSCGQILLDLAAQPALGGEEIGWRHRHCALDLPARVRMVRLVAVLLEHVRARAHEHLRRLGLTLAPRFVQV